MIKQLHDQNYPDQRKLPKLKLNKKLLGGINLFSIFSDNMYYFAFGIRRLHIPQIGFPLLFFQLILYICNQILAADVSDIAHAVQKRSPVNLKPVCCECHFPYMEVNHFQGEWGSARKKRKKANHSKPIVLCNHRYSSLTGDLIIYCTCTHQRSLYVHPGSAVN